MEFDGNWREEEVGDPEPARSPGEMKSESSGVEGCICCC